MKARIRDIEDSFGFRLRVMVTHRVEGTVVALEHVDTVRSERVEMSLYGAELLAGFILSARLSVPGSLPFEEADDTLPVRFSLVCGQSAHIEMEALQSGAVVTLGAPLWDRLYAELTLVIAHGRDMERRAQIAWH